MRKKQENGEPDESGDKSTDNSWIQAVKIWIDVEDIAKMEKAEKISKAAKKKAETYILYKLREDLALNKGIKKLVTLPNFEKNEEGYSTKDREKNTDSSEDKDKIETLLRTIIPAVSFSITTSRSSSAVPSKRKKQMHKLPRTEIGKKARKSRVEEMAGKLAKLDGVLKDISSLISEEKDKENKQTLYCLDKMEKKQENLSEKLDNIINLLRS